MERVEVIVREPFADGQIFGETGTYERVKGRLHYAIDPADPANQAIVDLDLAPVDDRGLVTFSGDFILLRPKSPDRGNNTLLYEVNNRGGLGMLPMFNLAPGANSPNMPVHAGDGLLFEQGYTLLWSAWNWDVIAGNERLQIELPVAMEHGEPVTGLVAAEFVSPVPAHSAPFMWGYSKGYPPVDPDDPDAVLSWRDGAFHQRNIIARASWSFSDFDTSRTPPQPTRVTSEEPFVPGRIYEVAYTARDPRVVGLGLATIRDAISYFRFGDPDLSTDIDRALAFGISQSGRVINHMIWQGFHLDETGRQVFDGALVHVAGAGKGSFNHRFAQTTRHPSHLEDQQYPADFFPFTTISTEDPVTGEMGSLLDLARTRSAVPKIIYTTTSTEYWTRAASLLHTDVLGKSDVPMAPNTRLYFFAGAQHGNWRWDRRGPYEHCTNALDHRYGMRALLLAMQSWLANKEEPPASVYPTFAAGTLGTVPAYRKQFPDIPTFRLPIGNLQPPRLDLGQRFAEEGIIDRHPVSLGQPFVTTVPLPDRDGIDQGGILLPDIAVPLATYTGWNLRRAEIGAPDKLARWSGSMLPFPADESSRVEAGDPRASLVERYPSRDDYANQITAAAEDLMKRRFLLADDISRIKDEALQRFDRIRAHPENDQSCRYTLLDTDQ
ncbi:MAG: alpha/beta hydrolase domain-containing protein [Pseudomonadota bacterium]